MTSMDGGARAWLVTVVADNFWRVSHYYEFDDLMQDGFMCWYRVVMKYETETGRVRSRAHIMRLFKTTFINHIHTLSKDTTVTRVEMKGEDCKKDMVFNGERGGLVRLQMDDEWTRLGKSRNVSDYEHMIAEAPVMLKPLLRAFIDCAPSPLLRARYRVGRDGSRETLNARLCRLIGVDPEQRDLVMELRSFLVG